MEIDLFGNVIVVCDAVESIKNKKKTPFDFINLIGKGECPSDMDGYSPWIVNSSFSMGKETVFIANELNKYHDLPDRMQYDFYRATCGGRKFFNKWAKAPKHDLEAVKTYYNVSNKVAEQYSKVLTEDQLDQIQSWYNSRKGGNNK